MKSLKSIQQVNGLLAFRDSFGRSMSPIVPEKKMLKVLSNSRLKNSILAKLNSLTNVGPTTKTNCLCGSIIFLYDVSDTKKRYRKQFWCNLCLKNCDCLILPLLPYTTVYYWAFWAEALLKDARIKLEQFVICFQIFFDFAIQKWFLKKV